MIESSLMYVAVTLGDGGFRRLVVPGGRDDRSRCGRRGRRRAAVRGLAGELAESGAQEPGVQAGEEEGVAEPAVGDLVPVRAGDAFDEAVDAQSSEVVGDLPAGHVLIAPAEQRREVGAEVAVGESVGQQPEGTQGREQGLDALAGAAQSRDAVDDLARQAGLAA